MSIVYRIEIKEPSLIVRLEEKGKKRILYLDTLQALAEPSDREALAYLTKIHLRSPNASRQKETLSFQQIEVAAAQSNEAIRLMAKTGRLYFEQKAILYFPLSQKISWKGERLSEKSAIVEMTIEGAPPSGAFFPGSPPWQIKEGRFAPLSTDVSWEWLSLFFRGPKTLEGIELKRFLEEKPPIIWKVVEEKPLQVLPELRLQDATGCFAHLWMHYPGVGRVAFEDFSPAIGGKGRLKQTEQQWERDLLETGFIRKVVGVTRYYCPADRVAESIQFLLELGWEITDPKQRKIIRQTSTDLAVREVKGGIQVEGTLRFGDKKTPLQPASHRLWLEIDSQSVGWIDRKLLQPLEPLLFDEQWMEGALFLPKIKTAALAPLLNSPSISWDEPVKRLIEQWTGSIESAPLGSDFQGALLPYQQKGVDWLSFLYRSGFSGLLADEMGLGKTVQVLAFFSRLRTNLPVLIVAPTSLLCNWEREIGRFLPRFSLIVHSGPDRTTDPSQLQSHQIILTSYALLRIDEALLRKLSFEVIVLDESQTIKNSSTQAAQAAQKLPSRFRIALSGTPMENRTAEIVSQFQFLLPGLVSPTDPIERLKQKIRPFLLRRRKQDVDIELPQKIEQTSWVEMEEQQAIIYQDFARRLKSGLLKKVEREGVSAHRMEILEAILRLRQLCCDPRLIGENAAGAKVTQLVQDVEEIAGSGRKILIYSQFTSMLSLLRRELSHWHPLYLDGSMSGEERGEQVNRFQENPDAKVFLLSLKAGGVGLNLTAAEYVVLFDPWWNEAVEAQAIDRAHRIGQQKAVIAKRYLTPNTIEEKIASLKIQKSKAAEELLDGAEETANWTTEDLLHLLS